MKAKINLTTINDWLDIIIPMWWFQNLSLYFACLFTAWILQCAFFLPAHLYCCILILVLNFFIFNDDDFKAKILQCWIVVLFAIFPYFVDTFILNNNVENNVKTETKIEHVSRTYYS